MKTAVVQLNAGNDKEANIQKALAFANKAILKGAKFILFPEVFIFRGPIRKSADLQSVAENIPGPLMAPFVLLSKKHKVNFLLGSVYEQKKNSRKVYNTSVLIDSSGKIRKRYRKIHLFNAVIGRQRIKESEYFLTGSSGVLEKIGRFNVGLSICYDLRFPVLYQKYAKQGANVLCVPSAFTEVTGKAHWESLLRARAIENLCYVLAPNQVGKDARGVPAFGNSMIIDPWGKILARATKNKEEIIFATLDRAILKEKRALLPGINS